MRFQKSQSVAFALAVSVLPLTAQVAVAHEPYVREAASAACETPALIKTIQHRFRIQAREVHHRQEWQITGLSHTHQHRYKPQDVHKSRAIARRYCHATAHFNDGTSRKIWYLIEGGMGFAGFGQSWLGAQQRVRDGLGNGSAIHNVEFCIDGLDKWNVYNSNCRALR
ncbi:MAG: hypothetical protein U5K75_04495 [Ahrensia sp.]|nr:hypothetical protein [Ahrensia sp.]